MSTTIIQLVRHAVHDEVDRVLVGRSDHAALSPAGMRQARDIAQHLARESISHLQSSPRRRALQTAQQTSAALHLPVSTHSELDEIDTGEWTRRSFQELAADERWNRWNAQRGSARIPGGESMQELQDRVVAYLHRVAARHRGARIVMVSHAEPIRAAVLYYQRIRLDDFATVRIDPGSITTFALHGSGGEVISVNAQALSPVAA